MAHSRKFMFAKRENFANFSIRESFCARNFLPVKYFKSHSSSFFEFLIWGTVKSQVSNLSLPRRFSLIQVRAKAGKLVHQQIVNQALLGESKHQLILGAYASNVVKSPTKECLCYHEFKKLYVYLLQILQIFFIKLINKLNFKLNLNT